KHMRKQYTYNQYDKLATYNVDHWDSASNSWQPLLDTAMGYASKTWFEYEVYWPASIIQAKRNATDIKLFPCPASDFIRIEATFEKAESFTASIVDISGRIVRQWNEENIQQYTRTVPLTELPSGNFILKLSGNRLNSITCFTVAR
ncbi:MAG: T9SS type A sorting domain-containing protein, partial [Chitinophagaceae bacterium]|nr:T9SS type A sorting domain-containing protein [Chitinophagaceae bacterium]